MSPRPIVIVALKSGYLIGRSESSSTRTFATGAWFFADSAVAANLSGETEVYYSHQRELVLNPSLGATYEMTPSVHVGLDSWLRGEYPRNPKPAMRTFGLGPAAYLGPAVMINFGRVWWAVGGYLRVTNVSHDLQSGEPYGPIYVRSMIGYDL